MMELVRQWLLGVACTAVVLAIAESLIPKGGVSRVCRLAGGLALLLAVVSPILRLDLAALSDAVEDYQADVQSREDEFRENNNLIYQTIIEGTAAAYIVDKAEELGIACQAEVTFSYDENGVPCPWEVTAYGIWTQGQQEAMAQFVENDLGVPRERQRYEEKVP